MAKASRETTIVAYFIYFKKIFIPLTNINWHGGGQFGIEQACQMLSRNKRGMQPAGLESDTLGIEFQG